MSSPHFSSGIVGSKWHARESENQPTREGRDVALREKNETPPRLTFLVSVDFHSPLCFSRSTILAEK